MWRPDGKALANIRHGIVADPAAWKRIVGAKARRERASRFMEFLARSNDLPW